MESTSKIQICKKATETKKQTEFIINLILLLIYPLFTIPYIIQGIKNKQWGAFFCLSVLMAFVGYLIIPTESEDLYRIYEGFKEISGLDLRTQLMLLAVKMDFLLSSMWLTIDHLGLQKELIPFTSVLIGYTSFFYVLYKWQKTHLGIRKEVVYLSFVILAFSLVSFRNYALNIRNFVAASSLMYGVFQLYFYNRKSGWIFIALAPLCHIMTMMIVPLVLLARFNVVPTKWCRIFFIISFVGFFIDVSGPISSYVTGLAFENESLQAEQATHFESDRYAGESSGANYSTNGLIAMYFGYFTNVFLYLYLIEGKKKESQIRNLSYLIVGMANFLFHMSIFYGRFMIVFRGILLLLLLWEYGDGVYTKYQLKFIKIYSVLSFISFLMSMYMTRDSLAGSLRIFYQSPLYYMFLS